MLVKLLSLTHKKGHKMYNPQSLKAEDFISHEEIEASLEYANQHKNDAVEIDRLSADKLTAVFHTCNQ